MKKHNTIRLISVLLVCCLFLSGGVTAALAADADDAEVRLYVSKESRRAQIIKQAEALAEQLENEEIQLPDALQGKLDKAALRARVEAGYAEAKALWNSLSAADKAALAEKGITELERLRGTWDALTTDEKIAMGDGILNNIKDRLPLTW